jgi:hypothetical protein
MNDQVYYKGQNGLEYANEADANLYGGGCIGKRTVHAPTFEPVTPAPVIMPVGQAPVTTPQVVTIQTPAVKVETAPEVSQDLRAQLESLTFEELQELAKTRKIAGWAIFKKSANLIEKLLASN